MPYELVFGCKPNIPSSFISNNNIVHNYEDYLTDFRYKMQIAHKLVRENCIKSKIISKKYFDKNCKPSKFKVGDIV